MALDTHDDDIECDHDHQDEPDAELQIVAAIDALPDRPLTIAEFQELQRADAVDAALTEDSPGDIDVLQIVVDDVEYHIQYFPPESNVTRSGWQQYEVVEK